MNQTRNTLPLHVRKETIAILNGAVADLFDLFARIKQAHWNVRGTAFIGLHKLLDEFAEHILKHIDLAAERATALGGVVEGTLRESAAHSRLKKKEEPKSISGMSDWIHELADVHAAAGENVRKAIRKSRMPIISARLICSQILRALDLQLWLLEAHINQQKPSK